MRNVVLTGGSRGLGLGIAQKLAASGFRVIAIARSETQQLRTAMEQATHGEQGALHFQAFDLSDVSAIPDLVKALRREFGSLYGLVNNAGLGTGGVLANMQDAHIERIIHLNVLSPMALTKYVVRSMMT